MEEYGGIGGVLPGCLRGDTDSGFVALPAAAAAAAAAENKTCDM